MEVQQKYTTDEIEKVLSVVIEVANVGEAILAKEIRPLGGALSLADDLMSLRNINVDLFKAQIGELSSAERARLRAVLKAKLDLYDKKLEAKIEGSADLLDEAVALTEQLVSLITRFRALFGL